jgi:Alpha/beta hydrolase domain
VKLDQHGNPRGGVRTTYIEVPTARYVAEAGSGLVCGRLLGGGQEPFPRETLASLYKSHDDYVRKVTSLVQRLEQEGWLLPADARAVREEAVRSDIPWVAASSATSTESSTTGPPKNHWLDTT